MDRSWSSVRAAVSRFRACWRPLALCDLAINLLTESAAVRLGDW